MLNEVIEMGRFVRDPELRHTQSGISVASFTLAVDRDFKDRETGEKKADFINFVAWKGTAEMVSRYFSKGRMAVVKGRLQIRDYTDRDGNKRTAAEVVADRVYFGDSKRDGAAQSDSHPAGAGVNVPGPSENEFAEIADEDGELPF